MSRYGRYARYARFALAPARRRARGVSLLTAVFLVVVLASLAAAIARVSMVQSSSGALDMLGVQAYQAARSGLEWGMFQQLRAAPPNGACIASPSTFAMPASGGLRSFTVTVRCAQHAANAPGNTTNRWTITAVACNQPARRDAPTPVPTRSMFSARCRRS